MSLLAEPIATARHTATLGVEGRVQSVAGLTVHVLGLPVPVGALCEIRSDSGRAIPAEVIGFRKDTTLLMPLVEAEGLTKGQRVRHLTNTQKVPVGSALLGRVLDAMGEACDGGDPICVDRYYPLYRNPPDAMQRPAIDTPISVGIRSINAMLTAGRGQRLGVFSGTGVGKSVLLGMMARYTAADVAVIALVGERGRELRDFIVKDLGPEGLKRSVLVVSTSDQSPPLRWRACFTATAIAEYFRDRGADVLLLMDSVTRAAMAARQIGLAAGEPPATKGYPPSVFAKLPRLFERSGRTERGSITGLYTVLVEGDDVNEPIADAVRGYLDGHIWLSRKLANRGQYPAVDVLESISRVMPDVVEADHLRAVQRVKRLLAVWEEIEDLVNIGAYAAGTNPEFDLVIRLRPVIEAFLRQGMDEGVDFESASRALRALGEQIDKAADELAEDAQRQSPAKSANRVAGGARPDKA
ncbi:MAG: FliI/YscN family ATPase [Phycisphaerae bacterium]